MKDNRRRCTRIRHNEVHQVNEELKSELGLKVYWGLSRGALYELIGERVGLTSRRVQYILNHTTGVVK
jgi:hypothetical protein